MQGRIEGPSSRSIDPLLYSTKTMISVWKVFVISASGKLWQQILNDHWFWNLGSPKNLDNFLSTMFSSYL